MNSRIVKLEDLTVNNRGDFSYQRLIAHDETTLYNVLTIEVDGAHPPRRVLQGTRNYYVIRGSGEFVVEDTSYEVTCGMLIVIEAGESYEYKGQMSLLEFNVGITDPNSDLHEDL